MAGRYHTWDVGEAPFLVYTNTTTETLDYTPDLTTHVIYPKTQMEGNRLGVRCESGVVFITPTVCRKYVKPQQTSDFNPSYNKQILLNNSLNHRCNEILIQLSYIPCTKTKIHERGCGSAQRK